MTLPTFLAKAPRFDHFTIVPGNMLQKKTDQSVTATQVLRHIFSGTGSGATQ